ncbi:transcriptional regulator protein [Beggiatoa sp. PS]|nr:transcriptional regulator protein [Beggiatoa sp. PS]
MTNCKLCKSDNISQFNDQEIISYKGTELSVSMEYSICNRCGREFISKQQIINNDARMRDAKRSLDGLMTSSEIYDARKKLGLTQEQASKVFGGGKNAFSKYERSEVSQSVAMDKLIRICLKHPNVFREMLASAGAGIEEYKGEQVCYENNIIPYIKGSAANQENFKLTTSKKIKEGAYG